VRLLHPLLSTGFPQRFRDVPVPVLSPIPSVSRL
jgi:hypothetical protein